MTFEIFNRSISLVYFLGDPPPLTPFFLHGPLSNSTPTPHKKLTVPTRDSRLHVRSIRDLNTHTVAGKHFLLGELGFLKLGLE